MATSTLASIGLSSKNGTLSTTLAIPGLASGMDWQTIVTELANAERAPETQWESQQSTIDQQNGAYSTIASDLATLQTDATTLSNASFFESSTATTSSSTTATATAAEGASVGTYAFNIKQLATAAQLNGATGISQVLAPGGDTGSVTIGSAGFATPVSAGTFTVDGAQITVATTDTLQTVFNNIASATGNAVTASYDPTADKITLSSTSPIELGSAADTSNFLQVSQLYNNGTGTVTSNAKLGGVQLTAAMDDADLATPITDGGSGQGAFTINGVTINYNASTEAVQDVLNSINDSTAGVTAGYDPVDNKFTLTNQVTGNIGISVKDVTGNFLAATGLSAGTLQSGSNLTYTLNGGSEVLQSQSNTITSASSGITGLSLTALTTGPVSATVGVDTSTISTAIQQFVTDYNAAQNFISSQQTVTTAADGTVTPGVLTGDQEATDIATTLRSLATAVVNTPATNGGVQQLNDLGIQTDGQDNLLTAPASSTLDTALTEELTSVQSLFADPTSGLAVQLNNFITATTGANGTLTGDESDLTSENTNLNTQISNLENKVTNDSAQWTSEFQAMETAEAQTNSELTYLDESITSGGL